MRNDLNNLTDELNNLSRIIVVGIWNALEDNLDFAPYNSQNNWLFEFGDNNVSNTDYFSTSNNNTRITLLKSGWYRIHLSALLAFISVSSTYWIILYKNDILEIYMDRHQTSAVLESAFHAIDSSAFIYSNGADYIEISGFSIVDNFQVGADDKFNQLTVEYLFI